MRWYQMDNVFFILHLENKKIGYIVLAKEKDYSYLDVGLVSLVEDWRAWGVIGVTGAPFQC